MSGGATPSVRIVQAAGALLEARCADGRVLSLRRMDVLDRLRLFKAVGPVLAENDAYLGIAYLACAVAAIDAVPVPVPACEAQLEALVGRLGDAGLEAVAEALEAERAARTETAPGN